MPTSSLGHSYSFAEYLAFDDDAAGRHEFFDGEIYAMAGGTPEHAALATEVTLALGRQLEGGPCRVFNSDLRLRVVASGLATYPDAAVVCGDLERDPESPTHVTNPKVVVEVTSDSTERYDRTTKLEHYQRIPVLEALVLVSHRERRIDVLTRSGEGWVATSHGPGESVEIGPIGCALSVDDLYDRARVA